VLAYALPTNYDYFKLICTEYLNTRVFHARLSIILLGYLIPIIKYQIIVTQVKSFLNGSKKIGDSGAPVVSPKSAVGTLGVFLVIVILLRPNKASYL
jgi:hypothetical protein